MNEVTSILYAIEAGDPHAAADLLPLVYDEVRRLAAPRLAGEKRIRSCSRRRPRGEQVRRWPLSNSSLLMVRHDQRFHQCNHDVSGRYLAIGSLLSAGP
jgi:hypothetical protein